MKARSITLVTIIIGVALFRYLPHPPNVSPVAAMALFAGATFEDRRTAFLVPFLALFVGDLLIGLHDTMLFVYLAFAFTVLAGFTLRNNLRTSAVTLTVVGTSVLFFLLTNLGVWMTSAMYPMTADGLMQAYTAGIPFFQNTLFGNLFFSAVLFGGYAVLQKHASWMRMNSLSHG